MAYCHLYIWCYMRVLNGSMIYWIQLKGIYKDTYPGIIVVVVWS